MMKKTKLNLMIACLLVISLISILASGWLLTEAISTNASNMCKATVTCPDGRKITCEGSACAADESDPSDPFCSADGKIKRCSDKNKEENTNTNSKKKDKKKNRNTNGNLSS